MSSHSSRSIVVAGRQGTLAAGAAAGLKGPGGAADDLRLFATGWIAGLIFFGTLLA